MTTIKNLGKGARRMVRFPGPFNKSKRNKKKLQKANGLVERVPDGYSSAEEGTDFYSDLEEEPQPRATPLRAPPPVSPRHAELLDRTSAQSLAGSATSHEERDNSGHLQPAAPINWDDVTTFRHVNGVTVYEQQEPDSKIATYMVSASVHATPEACLKAVLAIADDPGIKSDPMQFKSELLQELDPHTRVLKAHFQPHSWVSALAAPRETVVQQLWRQDENGVYLVMVHSTDHAAAPETEQPWWHWFSPVRSQIISAGWTLSPLQPEYTEGRPSHQCLVTLVLKLDLGGWLSSSSGSFMGSLLEPLMNTFLGRSVRNAFLQPLMLSVISLRDKVEQARFLVPPFTLGQAAFDTSEVQAQQEQLPGTPEQAGGGTRSILAHLRSSRKHAASQQRSYTLDTKFWRDPGVANFKVRGANYLRDNKKMKSEAPYFELLTTELVASEDRIFNVSRFLPAIRDCKAQFVFVIQVIFSKAPRLGLVMAWATSHDPYNNQTPWAHMTPHERCLQEFLEGSLSEPAANQKRHSMLKLIPSVPQGSWIIKQTVGSTPVLLGTKIATTYHRGPRWLEADIDMDSSGLANHVVALVKGVTTSQTIDMAIVLQGARPELLPERLLGTVRFSRLDLKAAIPLNPADYPDDDLFSDTFPSLPTTTQSAPPHEQASDTELDQTAGSLQSLHSLRSSSVTSVQGGRGGSLTGSQGHPGSIQGLPSSSSLTDSGHIDMPLGTGQGSQQYNAHQQQPHLQHAQQQDQQQPQWQQQQQQGLQGQHLGTGRSYSSALPARTGLTQRHSQALPTLAEPWPSEQAAPLLSSVAGSRQRAAHNGPLLRVQSLHSPQGGVGTANMPSSAAYAQNGQAEDEMQQQYGRVTWSDKPSLAASSRF